MSDKKKEVRWFSIMDYEKEADWINYCTCFSGNTHGFPFLSDNREFA